MATLEEQLRWDEDAEVAANGYFPFVNDHVAKVLRVRHPHLDEQLQCLVLKCLQR